MVGVLVRVLVGVEINVFVAVLVGVFVVVANHAVTAQFWFIVKMLLSPVREPVKL